MDPSLDAASIVIIGGIVLAALLWLWNYFIHDLVAEAAHCVTPSPPAIRLLSVLSFLAALLILWLLAGISALTYVRAVLALFLG